MRSGSKVVLWVGRSVDHPSQHAFFGLDDMPRILAAVIGRRQRSSNVGIDCRQSYSGSASTQRTPRCDESI